MLIWGALMVGIGIGLFFGIPIGVWFRMQDEKVRADRARRYR